MGNSGTRSRGKKTSVIPTKRGSISDIETARTGRQDFSTSHTLTGDISSVEIIPEDIPEEIIIKCSLEQVIKNFFKDYVIVWHDPNINSQENQQYIARLKKFCEVFTFTEWQKTRDFVQSSPATCHVITSGTNGELLIKEISSSQNIYIFCRNKDYHSAWAKTYSQVSCVETDIESVLSQIQSNLLAWYKQASSLKLNLPAFAAIFNDTDKSQMNNLHRFLKVIPNFKNRSQAKNDFLDLSKAIYSDPLIADFEQNYNEFNKEQTLRWYTQESFLYKVTNNCLRIATSDSIQYCRLLLQDIEQAIKEQYQTKSKNFNGLLYRGAYLSQEEWTSLKTNLNREIEMHGFLSVSKEKKVGLNFMKADPTKKVFITIIVPQGPNEEEQGFAELDAFSQFPQEKEVLFNVRSRFTILETEDEGLPYRHLVLLYGAQGFRKFLAEQNPIIQVKVDQISCNQCKAVRGDKIFFISLKEPQKQIYYCRECINSNFAPFLRLPPDMNPQTIKIPGSLLKNSYTTELPFYGYKCSSEVCQTKVPKPYFFTCIDCDQRWCQNCFENSHNSTHNIILETSPFSFWYQKMSTGESYHIQFQSELLTIRCPLFQQADMFFESLLYEQAIEYYSTYIQQNEAKGKNFYIALSYNNLGLSFDKQEEETKALECFLKSVEILESIHADNYFIATVYTNIGRIYSSQGEYTKALECQFKALEIQKSFSLDNPAAIVPYHDTYNNIGTIYSDQGEHLKALEFYFKALERGKLVDGDNHPSLATPYYNIGSTYQKQREFTKALEYYFKSLDIVKLVYGDRHPEMTRILSNIGMIFLEQGKHKKALEYLLKSVNIQKSLYGDNHPDIALSFNDIGKAFLEQGEHNKALEYFLLALDINKSVYKENHPQIAFSLSNIGEAFLGQGEYNKAIEYDLKALDTYKLAYGDGDNHSEIAACYQNIGLAFSQQGQNKKAIEYYFKSLDIYKTLYEDSHLDIATCYQRIAAAEDQQGDYEKALEYYLKSLDIAKLACGENHPTTGKFYNNIGNFYCHQGEDKKGLDYYFKCLDIYKSVYGDHHPDIETFSRNIGCAYEHLGEDEKALEYYFKSLEIAELAGEEKLPEVVTNYNQIFTIYSKQKEDKKALEFSLKMLNSFKAVYGDCHPNVITASMNIGLIYNYQEEYKKALEYLLPCLKIQISLYGENHPTTRVTQEKVLQVVSKLATKQPDLLKAAMASLQFPKK